MIREREINKFLNGRQFFILAAVLFVFSTILSTACDLSAVQGSTAGVCFTSISVLSLPPFLSTLLSMISIVGVCALLSLVNKIYSFTRDVTYLFASSFLLLNITYPEITTRLCDGTLLALVVVGLTYLLFSTYQSGYPQRRVFLISVILSCCCMFQYTFVYLIPVFFIGFLQMRAMHIRSALAMLFGLITPFWIVLGLGFVGFEELQAPQLVNVWEHLGVEEYRNIIIQLSVTAFVTLVLLFTNVLQIINYKMQVRAYNGFFLVLTILTMIVMAVDFDNVMVYLPVLNLCLSIQIAHTFTIQKYLRKYIPYLLFIMLCLGVFVWRVFI